MRRLLGSSARDCSMRWLCVRTRASTIPRARSTSTAKPFTSRSPKKSCSATSPSCPRRRIGHAGGSPGGRPMTEEEWLACRSLREMLGIILPSQSDRKLRLFAVACCRLIQQVFPDQAGVEYRLAVAERYADGLATAQELGKVQASHPCGGEVSFECFGHEAAVGDPRLAVLTAQSKCDAAALLGMLRPRPVQPARRGLFSRLVRFFSRPRWPAPAGDVPPEFHTGRMAQCALLRDIFGYPFRPVAFSRGWLTSDVVVLARGIYEERAFDRMPVLADALQDAGCDSEDILTHCRQPGEHVKGCWVVDLVLGKE